MDRLETIGLLVILMFILDDMVVHSILDEEKHSPRDDDDKSHTILQSILRHLMCL